MEEIEEIRKRYKDTNDIINGEYASIRLDISFIKDFGKLLNYIDTLQANKNKLINYIAIRENKTHEEVEKEFETGE